MVYCFLPLVILLKKALERKVTKKVEALVGAETVDVRNAI